MTQLSRRSLMTGAAASLLATSSRADIICSPFDFAQQRQCSVGLLNVPVVLQQCQLWCWAACAELAFKVQGYDVPQQQFVERAYGSADVCKTATGPVIADAVSGNWTDMNGQNFNAEFRVVVDYDYQVVNSSDPLSVVRDELEANRIVLAGTLGHAICITAMDYFENQFGQRQVASMTVRDPWPSSGNRYFMTPAQFYNGRLLAVIHFS